MEAIMEDSRGPIEEATVQCDVLPHDNRKFGYRYRHRDRDMAEAAADNCVRRIDPYRSPVRGSAYRMGAEWCVDVFYYSLD